MGLPGVAEAAVVAASSRAGAALCPATGKHSHASYVGAQEALRRVRRRRKNKREARVYRCPNCSGWHLTSKKMRKT